MQLSKATLMAIVAAVATASASPVLPRDTYSYFWAFQPNSLDTDFAGLKNAVIQAVNGKFWIGGTYSKSAQVICTANDGSATSCALSASNGNQPMYLASDGSLSYVAPNAAVPSGSNAKVWNKNGTNIAYQRTAATSAAQFATGDFVACQTNNGYQLFALEGYQGCAQREHVFHLQSGTTALSGPAYPSY